MLRNECVSKAIDFIIDNLNEEITIADVADYCHWSKYDLAVKTKTPTGEISEITTKFCFEPMLQIKMPHRRLSFWGCGGIVLFFEANL